MEQLIAHLFGDYILQSDWMAQGKTKYWNAAIAHVCAYCIPFCFLRPSLAAWAVIFGTHLLIARFRLARYVVWAKNWMGPRKFWYRSIAGGHPHWTDDIEYIKAHAGDIKPDDYYMFYGRTPPLWACPTGYPPSTPIWISTWLLIIADNTLHLAINYAALRWL